MTRLDYQEDMCLDKIRMNLPLKGNIIFPNPSSSAHEANTDITLLHETTSMKLLRKVSRISILHKSNNTRNLQKTSSISKITKTSRSSAH